MFGLMNVRGVGGLMFWLLLLVFLGAAFLAMGMRKRRTTRAEPRREPEEVVLPRESRQRPPATPQPVAEPSRPLVESDELVYIDATDWFHLDGECPALKGDGVPVHLEAYQDVAATHRVCPSCRKRRLRLSCR